METHKNKNFGQNRIIGDQENLPKLEEHLKKSTSLWNLSNFHQNFYHKKCLSNPGWNCLWKQCGRRRTPSQGWLHSYPARPGRESCGNAQQPYRTEDSHAFPNYESKPKPKKNSKFCFKQLIVAPCPHKVLALNWPSRSTALNFLGLLHGKMGAELKTLNRGQLSAK